LIEVKSIRVLKERFVKGCRPTRQRMFQPANPHAKQDTGRLNRLGSVRRVHRVDGGCTEKTCRGDIHLATLPAVPQNSDMANPVLSNQQLQDLVAFIISLREGSRLTR